VNPGDLLLLFLILRVVQLIAERGLSALNRQSWMSETKRAEAAAALGMTDDDMRKTLAYTKDKYAYGVFSAVITTFVTLTFLAAGGLGFFERLAIALVESTGSIPAGPIAVGLGFFGLLAVASSVLGLPFELFYTFRLEQKHGFNRQTLKGFFGDRLKGLILGVVIGAPLLAGLLWLIAGMGEHWWLYAWAVMSGFSIFAAWIYPTILAPLFNKFSPLPEGPLRDGIFALAQKIGFRAGGVFVMDASKRSSHGNAYFTGVFGAKRIVLFDTLVDSMTPAEVVAVLAHELGHFKLHHVRWGVIRGLAMTGVMFWLMSLFMPMASFYQAFGLSGVTPYGVLIVFGLWFSVVEFCMHPFGTWLSRRNEFAADRFAREALGEAKTLSSALMKLREKSHAMPVTHPWFSLFYHSHPPMLERLKALNEA